MRSTKNWTWEDAYNVAIDKRAMLDSVQHPVYVVIDLTESGALPRGIALPNLRHLLQTNDPEKQLLTFYVATSKALETFLNMAEKIFRLQHIFERYRFVHTFEQALREIKQHQQVIAESSSMDD